MFRVAFLLIVFSSTSESNEYIRFHPRQLDEPPKPIWPKNFFVQGILSLPYGDLDEPFSAWYNGSSKKSRVDMYGGVTKTLQFGFESKYGHQYQVVPVTTEHVKNKKTCFVSHGTKKYPVKPQSMLPDIRNFTFIGVRYYMGSNFDAWQYKVTIKKEYSLNTYTLYVSRDSQKPVYYEMDGYNTLLDSHFDKYRIHFTNISTKFDPEIFNIPTSGLDCKPLLGPIYESMILSNPMKEYIHPVDDRHVHHMHKEFCKQFNKTLPSDHLSQKRRKDKFRHNLRYIHSMNRQQLSFKLKINHLAEHSPEDIARLRGRRAKPWSERADNETKIFDVKSFHNDIPEEKDWRLYGAVTPVKDQSTCGSCWSFGTTGAVEGEYFLKTGHLLHLSQQNLMDCSWGYDNQGCDGGIESEAFKYIKKHGIATDEDYGHYLAVDGMCHADQVPNKIKISGQGHIPSGDKKALRVALANIGPIDVGIDASQMSFTYYSHGVYYDTKCGNKEDDLDHAVLAVGYGKMNGEHYWLIKNSWSSHWGDEGYILMSAKDNNCGVATDANYVII